MKHFIEIEALRQEDIEVLDGVIKPNNCSNFAKGDIISITEKIDGANASATYDDGIVKAFSHKKELTTANTLRGFYEYVLGLNTHIFSDNPQYIVFGEWLVKHTVQYNVENYNKWYVYSLWNKVDEKWETPDIVKAFCLKYDLEYVHELYYGEFISWEHIRSFMNKPFYGDRQEGVVVRNVTKMVQEDNRLPFILKVVNNDFKETMRSKEQRVVDPQKVAEKEKATKLMQSIVTRARVEKLLNKLVDEGELPEKFTPNDMGMVAKKLPKEVYEDLLKEEKDTLSLAGEYASKLSSQITMQYAREILLSDTVK